MLISLLESGQHRTQNTDLARHCLRRLLAPEPGSGAGLSAPST